MVAEFASLVCSVVHPVAALLWTLPLQLLHFGAMLLCFLLRIARCPAAGAAHAAGHALGTVGSRGAYGCGP